MRPHNSHSAKAGTDSTEILLGKSAKFDGAVSLRYINGGGGGS